MRATGEFSDKRWSAQCGCSEASSGSPSALAYLGQLVFLAGRLASSQALFLELFAGKAGITEAVHLLGAPVLPPVDIELSDLVPTPRDVVDVAVWAHIMAIIAAGLVFSCMWYPM